MTKSVRCSVNLNVEYHLGAIDIMFRTCDEILGA
jgi:hypothetical protein